MLNTLITSALATSILLTPVNGVNVPVAGQAGELVANPRILALETLDLTNRYPVVSISEGFRENILIALEYLSLQGETLIPLILQGDTPSGLSSSSPSLRVEDLRSSTPRTSTVSSVEPSLRLEEVEDLQARNGFFLILQPGEVFAFHNKGILSEFKEDKIVTQESDFTTNTGYKVVAGLGGNGVCHLASFMNLVADEAGLEVTAPTNHNFAEIPGIDRKYGISISTRNSPERQNLYIRNSYDFPVQLRFVQNGDLLALMVFRVI